MSDAPYIGKATKRTRQYDPPKGNASDEPTKSELCQQWLAELLVAGPVPIREVRRLAQEQGYGARAMEKARDALDTRSEPAKGVSPPVHYLCLPHQDPPVLSGIPSTPYVTPER